MSETIPTKEKLARALEARKGDKDDPRVDRMIKLAREGHYDDFESSIEMPQSALLAALRSVGYHQLAERVLDGDFDATEQEAADWMRREGHTFLKQD